MKTPRDELRALFDQDKNAVQPSSSFDLELQSRLRKRRYVRTVGLLGTTVFCLFMSFGAWSWVEPIETSPEVQWVATLDELWTEHDTELDDLIEESTWDDDDDAESDWPDEYTVFAQMIDESENKETLQ